MSTAKTNKSFTKRIKKTKNDKLIAKRPGLNHFNAKESANSKRKKRRTQELTIKDKKIAENMPFE